MDEDLKKKERVLERYKVDEEIADKQRSIAEKKALEREAKQRYGSNWKKVLGLVRSIKPDKEVVQDLYGMGVGSDLRDLSNPKKWGRKY